jgi:hypothetical protein
MFSRIIQLSLGPDRGFLCNLDSSCAKFMEFVQLDSLGVEHSRHIRVIVLGLVVGKAGLQLGGQQGFPKIVGQRKSPELGVFGENGDLRKVLLEEVVNAAGTGLAAQLVDIGC